MLTVSDEFMKDYLWIIALVIVAFTIFIGKMLNTNIDPQDIEENDEDNEPNSNNNDEN